MTLLIAIVVILIIAALLIWAVDYLPVPSVPANLIKVLIIVLAVLAIVQRSGIGL